MENENNNKVTKALDVKQAVWDRFRNSVFGRAYNTDAEAIRAALIEVTKNEQGSQVKSG